MNSRERVLKAINHEEPDRVPIDLGGTITSGIMAGALVRLREHLGLTGPVKVHEVYQMLGDVTRDVCERFHVDVLPVFPPAIGFDHIPNRDHRPWTLFDGTEVWMPGAFDVEMSPQGDWLMHENCDPDKPVIARMPKDGFYFEKLDFLSNNTDYKPPSIESLRNSDWRRLTDEVLRYIEEAARSLRENTDKALVLTNWEKATLGPARVGSYTDWFVLLASEQDYIAELFGLATEIAIENLKMYQQALGDNIDVIFIDGFDYGTQNREMFSPRIFEKLYVPCYTPQCTWIHENTSWKIAKHCDGSITRLIGPMIDAGIDILNPIQTSAAGMDPTWLKDTFGEQLVFWGGGVDTQRVLPFESPEKICQHVAEHMRIFAPGGGFVWATVHNIQYDVPPENVVTAFDAAYEFGHYPME